MIHNGDESFEVEKADDSEMARNFKTLDEGMGSGNGMEWNDDCGELGGLAGSSVSIAQFLTMTSSLDSL
ncbi:hypothetical protein MRB53_005586 [Persea americana]|uniref:Uncharacterized protein n=1 Tax=Persea americana TaxID=3435 RepID=A0ACC2MDZ8_PERAE|nr:hypothetical protein MRB53_005586 [Persea americana]